MPMVKTSQLNTFRMPIVLRKVIDAAAKEENLTFSEFCRESLRLKLEKMGINVEV